MERIFSDCTIHPLGEAPTPLRFTVMYIRFQGKWLHVRKKDRDTWECAGGHIETGETPAECARRECYEEAGVVDAVFTELFDYWAQDQHGNSSGRVFLVEAAELADIPEEFEMAERMLSDGPPERLTYAFIYDTLYPAVCDFLKERHDAQ